MWTKEAPTKAGFYWIRERRRYGAKDWCVELAERMEGDEFYFMNTDLVCGANELALSGTEFWSVPLEPPL